MSLRYGLLTARDLFEKLERDFEVLDGQVTSDAVFNFVVTAYHLCEWITEDPSITPQESLLKALKGEVDFYHGLFGEDFYFEVTRHRMSEEVMRSALLPRVTLIVSC